MRWMIFIVGLTIYSTTNAQMLSKNEQVASSILSKQALLTQNDSLDGIQEEEFKTVRNITPFLDSVFANRVPARENRELAWKLFQGLIGMTVVAAAGAGAYFSFKAQESNDKKQQTAKKYDQADAGSDFESLKKDYSTYDKSIQQNLMISYGSFAGTAVLFTLWRWTYDF